MENKKRKGVSREDASKLNEFLTCHMCGRQVETDACIWQEDDEGSLYCQDCKAERESCGCSD